MKKFILGYMPDSDVTKENIVQFDSKAQADHESEEWVEVNANNLDEAKDLYEATFKKWQSKS